MSPSRAGQDRWLLSYADLVTLLFACFTTAYAASAVQSAAAPEYAASPGSPAAAERKEPEPAPPQSHVDDGPSLRDVLAPVLANSPGVGQLETTEDERGLVISLPESATFSSGSADLTAAAEGFLVRLADALRAIDVRVRIEGHTDDRPISSARYGSNWELSTARASAVVVYLVTQAAFPPELLSAAGYGEFHPRASNDAPERRALNRRVDVVVMEPDTDMPLETLKLP